MVTVHLIIVCHSMDTYREMREEEKRTQRGAHILHCRVEYKSDGSRVASGRVLLRASQSAGPTRHIKVAMHAVCL